MADHAPLLVDLGDAHDPAMVGAKAATLARLAAVASVPRGVVITVAAWERARDGEGTTLDAIVAEVARRLPARRLAVRSSAVAEDLADASFAGQYRSLLGVEHADLAQAVAEVWASASSDQVRIYGTAPQGDRDDGAMAVLVQELVDAEAAGIAFSRDPRTGERIVLVDAVEGLGDRLADGSADAERWRWDGATAEAVNGAHVLDEAAVADVGRLVHLAEETLGHPVDVEWAIADGRVHLLQARPITGLPDVEPIPQGDEIPAGSWMREDVHHDVPMSPLLYSFFPEALRQASERARDRYGLLLERIEARRIDGSLYFRVVPIGGKDGPPPPAPLLGLLARLHPAMRARTRTARAALQDDAAGEAIARWRTERLPIALGFIERAWDTDLTTVDAARLAAWIREARDEIVEEFAWSQTTDLGYLIPLVQLRHHIRALGWGLAEVGALLGDLGADEHLDALRALADDLADRPEVHRWIEQAAPDADLATVRASLQALDPAFAAGFDQHLRRWGTQAFGYDVYDGIVADHPVLELRSAAALVGAPPRPSAAERLVADARARLSGEELRRFEELLARTRDAFPIREQGESMFAGLLGTLWNLAREAGRRLADADRIAEPDHTMWLTVEEIADALGEDGGDLRALVARRRGEHLWAVHHPGPPHLGPEAPLPDLRFVPGALRLVNEAMFTHIEGEGFMTGPGDGLRGLGASGGRHTGPVRIVRGPDDFARVRSGDVVVCRMTTSVWSILFPVAGALVTEVGGLLSHPAIVGREYGLPVVLSVADATRRLREGDVVTVDGATGVVEHVG